MLYSSTRLLPLIRHVEVARPVQRDSSWIAQVYWRLTPESETGASSKLHVFDVKLPPWPKTISAVASVSAGRCTPAPGCCCIRHVKVARPVHRDSVWIAQVDALALTCRRRSYRNSSR